MASRRNKRKPDSDNTRAIREWLNKTYREHDHEKLSEVPNMLEMYADNPVPLIKRIIKKYKIKTNRLPKAIKSILNEKKKGGKTKSSKKAKETTAKKPKESKSKTSKKTGKLGKQQPSARRDRNRQKISMQAEDLNAVGEKSFEDMSKEELVQECYKLRKLTNALKKQLEQIQQITNAALDHIPEIPTPIAGEPRLSFAAVQESFGGAEIMSGDGDFKPIVTTSSAMAVLEHVSGDTSGVMKVNTLKDDLENIGDAVSYKTFKDDYFDGETTTPMGTSLPRVFELLQEQTPTSFGDPKITLDSFKTAMQMFQIDPDSPNAAELFLITVSENNPVEAISKQLYEFDTDTDGHISIYEMPDLLRSFKIDKTPEELYKIFHWIDLDQSFKIDKKEFENFIWDEWKKTENKKVDDLSAFMNEALDRVISREEETAPSNVTEEIAAECLSNIMLEDATLESFVSAIETKKLRAPQYVSSNVNEEHIYEFIQPFNAENILRCATLLDVQAEEYGDDEDWHIYFMNELVDAIYEVYLKTGKLLGVFSVGEKMDMEHFTQLCNWMKIGLSQKQIENKFRQFDTNDSNDLDVHELGPEILKIVRKQNTMEPVEILQHWLS